MKNLYLFKSQYPSILLYNKSSAHADFSKTVDTDFYLSIGYNFCNIYITSDEKIYDRCYVLSDTSVGILYLDGIINTASMLAEHKWKKIVLTTDPELIFNGVQAVNDEFLKWLVENPNCKEIEVVKYSVQNITGYNPGGEVECFYTEHYKIILPDEKFTTDWTPEQGEQVWIKVFSNWSLGIYIGFDVTKNQYVVRESEKDGSYFFVGQEILPYSAMPNEPKPLTIEEAAKKFYENNIDASNIPKEHYEVEIQDLMIGFASEWQLKQLKYTK